MSDEYYDVIKWFLCFLAVGVVWQLPAQQLEAERKLLTKTRAKVEKGDAQSQVELGETLGTIYFFKT